MDYNSEGNVRSYPSLLFIFHDLLLFTILCCFALMAAFKVVHYSEVEPQIAIILGYLARSGREYGKVVDT
jgi:hypothetical protein